MDNSFKVEIDAIKKDISRLEKIFDLVQHQAITTEKLVLEVKHIREDTTELTSRIREVEQKPQKRYDGLVTQILNNIITIIIATIAFAVGLKK